METAQDLEKKSRLSSDKKECGNSIRENALQFALTIYYDMVFDLGSKKKKIDENNGSFIYHPPACYANWEPSSIEI